jgi:hypothetical protein
MALKESRVAKIQKDINKMMHAPSYDQFVSVSSWCYGSFDRNARVYSTLNKKASNSNQQISESKHSLKNLNTKSATNLLITKAYKKSNKENYKRENNLVSEDYYRLLKNYQDYEKTVKNQMSLEKEFVRYETTSALSADAIHTTP